MKDIIELLVVAIFVLYAGKVSLVKALSFVKRKAIEKVHRGLSPSGPFLENLTGLKWEDSARNYVPIRTSRPSLD